LQEGTELLLKADAVSGGPHLFLVPGHEARELTAHILLKPLIFGLDVVQHVGQLFLQSGQRRLFVVEGEIVIDRLPGFGENEVELVDRRVLVVHGELVGDAVFRLFDLLH
jgi:hypothetical protein